MPGSSTPSSGFVGDCELQDLRKVCCVECGRQKRSGIWSSGENDGAGPAATDQETVRRAPADERHTPTQISHGYCPRCADELLVAYDARVTLPVSVDVSVDGGCDKPDDARSGQGR